MSKMTDKEIIQALECYSRMEDGLHEQALDLINRLKGDAIHYRRKAQNQKQELSRLNAEIEKLTINMNVFGLGMKREKERADTIKSEAIKEFAERLKEHLKGNGGLFCVTTMNAKIDNLVKEMVGEQE